MIEITNVGEDLNKNFELKTEEAIKESRNAIERLAHNSSKRFKIRKNILEKLMFKTYCIQEKKGISKDFEIKLIDWNFKYYDKLDLSELSTENVFWGNIEELFESGNYVLKYQGNIKNLNKGKLDFSNSNIIIDIENSFEAKNSKSFIPTIDFHNVNFENVNLSYLPDTYDYCITDSNFKNTKIKLRKLGDTMIFNSTIENCNLSNQTIYASDYLDNGPIAYSNIKNTRCNVIYDIDEFDQSYIDEFDEFITDGYFDGCYIYKKQYVNSKYKKQLEEQNDLKRKI